MAKTPEGMQEEKYVEDEDKSILRRTNMGVQCTTHKAPDMTERSSSIHYTGIGYRIGCRIGAHWLNAESTKLAVNGQAEQARRAQSMPEVLKARKGAQRAR